MWIQVTRSADNEKIMVNTNQVLAFGPPVQCAETPLNTRGEILTVAGINIPIAEPPSFIHQMLEENDPNARRQNS